MNERSSFLESIANKLEQLESLDNNQGMRLLDVFLKLDDYQLREELIEFATIKAELLRDNE